MIISSAVSARLSYHHRRVSARRVEDHDCFDALGDARVQIAEHTDGYGSAHEAS
jgi:hypothetical protein